MHRIIHQTFDDICRQREAAGAVLEVGAVAGWRSLLCLPALEGATEKVGINLEGPAQFGDIRIVEGNANSMPFEDNRFDTVLSNATLEHDPQFWLTLSEIRRVARPGALVVIGVPGYTTSAWGRRWLLMSRWPGIRWFMRFRGLDALFHGTVTFRVHNDPGDYYRFGVQAVEEVLLQGMVEKRVQRVMTPPRLIGSARMPTET